MFALGFYTHETALFYITSPDVGDDLILSLDTLAYASVSRFSVQTALLNHRVTAFVRRRRPYTLIVAFDKPQIAGFFKELTDDLRSRLVPYEEQPIEPMLRPYGVWLLELGFNPHVYVPRRLLEDLALRYKRVVAETGHESFGIVFEEFTALFNRKGVILGEGKFDLLEDQIEIQSLQRLAEYFRKKPKGILFPSGPRQVRGVVVPRAPPIRPSSTHPCVLDTACRGLSV